MKRVSRREFLKYSGMASSSILIPGFLSKLHAAATSEQLSSSKILVIIQLSGGNDGLNTVVPYTNDIYYRMRPKLGIKGSEVLRINDDIGLNPAMQELMSLYDRGYVSIINNVGYPNPTRSHFRSMDIWHTASNSNELLASGWLGRYLDAECGECVSPHTALSMNGSIELATIGANRRALGIHNPSKFYDSVIHSMDKYSDIELEPAGKGELEFLYKTIIETRMSADVIYAHSKKYKSQESYPPGKFAQRLKQMAELIVSGLNTRIYYVNLGGFDTHAGQKNRHYKLLQQYSSGLAAFCKELEKNGLLKDTLVLTFSEFGRRVGQNASGGTDHGTASNVFVVGGGLKKAGIYNELSNLTNLTRGDIEHTIDFRQVYATILDKWMKADDKKILQRSFEKLAFI